MSEPRKQIARVQNLKQDRAILGRKMNDEAVRFFGMVYLAFGEKRHKDIVLSFILRYRKQILIVDRSSRNEGDAIGKIFWVPCQRVNSQ